MRDRHEALRAVRVQPELAAVDVKPRAAPPAERRARIGDALDRNLDPAQRVRDQRLLGLELRRALDVQPIAAAAAAHERLARRLHARRRWRHDLDQLAARERLLLLDEVHAHAIAGRGARHERDATRCIARDTVAAGRERRDF